MLCNILEYCSQTLDIQWTEGIATHFIFIYDFIIIWNFEKLTENAKQSKYFF
jgi:hypothetical protein